MDSWYRTFAYVTGSIVIGLFLILFTHSFFTYVNYPGSIGYITLTAYGLIYVNLSFVVNRRYSMKIQFPSIASYTMAIMLVLPTLLWIYTKKTDLADSRMVFILTIIFASFLGAYFGIKVGSRKRLNYLKKLKQNQPEDLPEDLQRPHDELNKN